MKKIILLTSIVLVSAILLNGCMLSTNTPNQGAVAKEHEIVVEKTETTEPAQIPGCPNKVTAQDWATILEMESCLEVKHQRVEWNTKTGNVYELKNYDSDMIVASIEFNADKTMIDAKISYKKPCIHAKSYSINLEFIPPIKNYLNQGKDIDNIHLGEDDQFWTFPNEKGTLETIVKIASDGQDHKIIPILTCIYDHTFYIKADAFYGKAVYVK